MFRAYVSVFVLAGFLTAQAPAVFAQSAMTPATTPQTAAKTTTQTTLPATKVKKPRSEKQKKNDEIMRACGAKWKAAKADGTAKGQKWRDFLKNCRKEKKDEQKVQ